MRLLKSAIYKPLVAATIYKFFFLNEGALYNGGNCWSTSDFPRLNPIEFMMTFEREAVRSQIPLVPFPPKHSFLPIPQLMVFLPAAKLMALEHYYNCFKPAREKTDAALTK